MHGTNAATGGRAWRWARIAAALLLVNFALSFHNVWPTPWITMWPEISVEAAAIALLAIVLARRGAFRPWVVGAFAVVMLLLAAARYMEVTAPALYGRGINLYWDSQHLPAVAAMMTNGVPSWQLGAGLIAALAGLVVLYRAFCWALRTIAAATAEHRLLAGLASVVVAAYVVGYYGSVLPILKRFSIPVTQTYVRQLEFVAEALAGGEGEGLPAEDPFAGWVWKEPPRADVFVVFVESYGAVAYDAEDLASVLAPHRAGLEAAVAAAGSGLVSAYATSPTFGGVSWLAHSSLLTGIDVTESGAYNVLLTQHRTTLVDLFDDAGYRTLALMPGLRGDWPEGSFYGFDEIYGESALEYSGPAFGWWRVPDQFALAKLHEAEVATPGRAPLMTFFTTISTHMPFYPTPYQPDWQALTGAEPYSDALVERAAAAVPDRTDLRSAYAAAVAYTYDYLGAYLDELGGRDYVLFVLGDHQPPATVSGPGARWDVPVHVIASDRAVLDRFVAAGFAEGAEPPAEPVGRTNELGALLLEALGATRTD